MSELKDRKAALGQVKIRQVPPHVTAATCHVAEHLRTLAEWLERGDFSTHQASPDGAVILLYCATTKRLTAAPIGVEVPLSQMQAILQAATTSLWHKQKTGL
jgi:hypothetical protein